MKSITLTQRVRALMRTSETSQHLYQSRYILTAGWEVEIGDVTEMYWGKEMHLAVPARFEGMHFFLLVRDLPQLRLAKVTHT